MKLAWSLFLREWRAGELRLAALALVLAVASVSGVGFVQERVAAALVAGAARLTAGDLVLSSDHELGPEWTLEAQRLGLAVSRAESFPSMLRGPEHSILVSVKVVQPNFPLRGALRLEDPRGEPGPPAAAPGRGQLYLDPGIPARLGLAPGAPLQLGQSSLAVAGILADEPDAAMGGFTLAPRVLMAEADLPATGLVRPGSRISWRIALAGAPSAVAEWRRWATPRLVSGEHLESPLDSRPEVRSLVEQAGQFLRLASLASVLLAGVALLFALRRHVSRSRDQVAILRCLGASGRQVFLLQLWCLVFLCAASTLAGWMLGIALQAVLAVIIAPLVGVPLPFPGPMPLLQSAASALVLLAGFAVPGLRRLLAVPALQVLRSDAAATDDSGRAHLFELICAACALVAVALIGARQPLVALFAVGVLLAVGLASAACARAILALCEALSDRLPQLWRQGLRGLRRQPLFASLQAGALSVGLMVLLVLGLVRGDLIRTWEASIPKDAPNHFIIGIQADERAALADYMRSLHGPKLDLRPLIRARLTAIDHQPVRLAGVTDPRERALLDREFNLSFADHYNQDNSVIAGAWWPEAPPDAGLSLEQGFAERLHLTVGSHLTFEIAGRAVESRVGSIRKVHWDSFEPNFFVLARPGLLEEQDASYITSFRIEPGDRHTADALAARFPQVSLIDTGALIGKVQALTGQVALAVECVFAMSVLSGIAVLLAGIRATHDERLREGALLRALGASSAQLRALLYIEFGVLGCAAGATAAVGALLAGWGVTHYVLGLAWSFDWRLPLLGTLIGLLLVGTTAALALRPLSRAVPAESLRLFS